tara:strand:- start:183 stop:365 length:183 start_codon:yes stop_codon:yes gene_type:complete
MIDEKEINAMLREGKNINYIAGILQRHPSSIYRRLWGGRKAPRKINKPAIEPLKIARKSN